MADAAYITRADLEDALARFRDDTATMIADVVSEQLADVRGGNGHPPEPARTLESDAALILQGMRGEIQSAVGEVRQEVAGVREAIGEIRGEMRMLKWVLGFFFLAIIGGFGIIHQDLGRRIDGVSADMQAGFTEIRRDLADIYQRLVRVETVVSELPPAD